jgi:hypothetical protein
MSVIESDICGVEKGRVICNIVYAKTNRSTSLYFEYTKKSVAYAQGKHAIKHMN